MPEISIFLRIQENAKKKGQSNLISCRTYLTLRLGETEKGKLFPSKKSLDNRRHLREVKKEKEKKKERKKERDGNRKNLTNQVELAIQNGS